MRQIKEYKLKKPLNKKIWFSTVDTVFDMAHNMADAIAKKHPLYTPACRMPDLVKASDPIINHTFDAGEGVLIPGEILHHAKDGCRSFVILQPFGCPAKPCCRPRHQQTPERNVPGCTDPAIGL